MKEPHETLLGLDLGTNSIGWALLALDEDSSPTGILASGVRVFPAGVDGDFEKGREESRNSKRRSVRLARRQIRRRSRRKKKLYNLLAKSKLLPPADTSDPIEIHKKLLHLDGQLRLSFAISHRNQQLLPYLLREKALREALTPFELGRAIYHLAQRRGFLSNRKTSPKENEDCGVVKQSIVDLDAEIKASGAPTLGAYLCSLDPDVARIRCRYISRSMITEEFEKILQQQAPFHPILRDRQFVSALREVIFYQRPLKSQRHLIGFCELEPKKRRAALSYPEVQRWRYLQTLNNLKVLFVNGDERKLSDKERSLLIEYLERKGDLSFSRVKQILGFPLRGKDAVKFNLEEGGEKRIPGNRTLSAIRNIFGDSFDTIGPKDIEKIYHDLVSIRNPSVLQRKGARVWGLSQEKAAKFADLQLENDYARLSLKAIRKILPFLEKGLTYAKALECAYPGRDSSGKEPLGLLPPVFEAIPSLRNPAVARVLTELRKIINAIIEKYGKPTMIRLELARDLKRSKKARQERWREMRAKQQAREKIIKKIQKEIGICSPSRSDVLKGLLFEECGGQCPYTGFQFGFADLYGTHPKADVEHILPFSRSLDDSFLNKTLCLARENRQRKRNRTPFEAYGGDPARWNEILHRVSKFNGDSWLRRQKLARFKTENLSSEFLNDFCSRQLNDTRYASTLARDYLGLLYGGYIDASRKTRIQTCTGGTTSILRKAWGLNRILGFRGEKNRQDHRHHAVDAIVIALTDSARIISIAKEAQRVQYNDHWRSPIELPPPWHHFYLDVEKSIHSILVSHRPCKRRRGALHKETNYRLIPSGFDPVSGGAVRTRSRKPISDLTKQDLEAIPDERIRKAIRNKWIELKGSVGTLNPFVSKELCPAVKGADGKLVFIRHVRLDSRETVRIIGRGCSRRAVSLRSNFELRVLRKLASDGKERFTYLIVSLFDAVGKEKVLIPNGWVCLETLKLTDILISSNGEAIPLVIRGISKNEIECTQIQDGRSIKEIKKAKERIRISPKRFLDEGFRRARIDVLGNIICPNERKNN